jgi:hypothetical protein
MVCVRLYHVRRYGTYGVAILKIGNVVCRAGGQSVCVEAIMPLHRCSW